MGHKTIRIANKMLVEFEQWLHFDTLVYYESNNTENIGVDKKKQKTKKNRANKKKLENQNQGKSKEKKLRKMQVLILVCFLL